MSARVMLAAIALAAYGWALHRYGAGAPLDARQRAFLLEDYRRSGRTVVPGRFDLARWAFDYVQWAWYCAALARPDSGVEPADNGASRVTMVTDLTISGAEPLRLRLIDGSYDDSVDPGTERSLYGGFALTDSLAWAVGTAGTIVRWNGSKFEPLTAMP